MENSLNANNAEHILITNPKVIDFFKKNKILEPNHYIGILLEMNEITTQKNKVCKLLKEALQCLTDTDDAQQNNKNNATKYVCGYCKIYFTFNQRGLKTHERYCCKSHNTEQKNQPVKQNENDKKENTNTIFVNNNEYNNKDDESEDESEDENTSEM
jgi:hypothetical protein